MPLFEKLFHTLFSGCHAAKGFALLGVLSYTLHIIIAVSLYVLKYLFRVIGATSNFVVAMVKAAVAKKFINRGVA